MCGIVGYIGQKNAIPVLIDGLRRLEYRGYDSSGISFFNDGEINTIKAVGKIKELEKKINIDAPGNIGIAHTRWATHGKPTEVNAHPHTDCQGKIRIVHNGIIKNYSELKKELVEKGHVFISETDTEVLAHLIEENFEGNLAVAVKKSLAFVRGAYGLVVIHEDVPDRLIAARKGSPLLIGLGENETIIASDASAIIRYTKQVIYLEDGDIVEIDFDNFRIFSLESEKVEREAQEIQWEAEKIEKAGYPDFMLKEIFEQNESVANTFRGRLILKDGLAKLGGLDERAEELRKIKRLIIVGCGTAYTAASVGEYIIEEYAGIPVEVDYSHEFRYRKPIIDRETALIAISQSGETADTLAAVREAKEKGALTIGVVNVVGSTIARETDMGIYNHAGPEISVASTKAFTSQLTVLILIALYLGRQRQMSLVTGQRIAKEMVLLPEKIKKVLKANDQIKKIAEKYKKAKNFAYLGRKYNQAAAFEGAIKLKEISYVHAEGFASGEMKHGPIAMIDKNFPSFFISPTDSVYEKNLSSMEEIKARGGPVIAIATQGNDKLKKIADDVIFIPKTLEALTPILAAIPLQLFAYHMAVLNKRNVDKPRNLAKSVTVE